MKHQFKVHEKYLNINTDLAFSVFNINKVSKDKINLTVIWFDDETGAFAGLPEEFVIKKGDLKCWKDYIYFSDLSRYSAQA